MAENYRFILSIDDGKGTPTTEELDIGYTVDKDTNGELFISEIELCFNQRGLMYIILEKGSKEIKESALHYIGECCIADYDLRVNGSKASADKLSLEHLGVGNHSTEPKIGWQHRN